jgi:hypothetical protein
MKLAKMPVKSKSRVMTKPTVPRGFSFTSLISESTHIERFFLSAELSATVFSLFNLPYL